MPGFITDLPPEGTHQDELLNQHTIAEEVTSFNSTQEEEIVQVFEVVDSKEDFEVFDQPDHADSSITTPRPQPYAQVSSNQKKTDVPEAMVLQRKNISLLEPLESHVRGSTHEIEVHPRPPTPLHSHTSLTEPPKKKRKRGKKGKEVPEEGKIPPTRGPEP